MELPDLPSAMEDLLTLQVNRIVGAKVIGGLITISSNSNLTMAFDNNYFGYFTNNGTLNVAMGANAFFIPEVLFENGANVNVTSGTLYLQPYDDCDHTGTFFHSPGSYIIFSGLGSAIQNILGTIEFGEGKIQTLCYK